MKTKIFPPLSLGLLLIGSWIILPANAETAPTTPDSLCRNQYQESMEQAWSTLETANIPSCSVDESAPQVGTAEIQQIMADIATMPADANLQLYRLLLDCNSTQQKQALESLLKQHSLSHFSPGMLYWLATSCPQLEACSPAAILPQLKQRAPQWMGTWLLALQELPAEQDPTPILEKLAESQPGPVVSLMPGITQAREQYLQQLLASDTLQQLLGSQFQPAAYKLSYSNGLIALQSESWSPLDLRCQQQVQQNNRPGIDACLHFLDALAREEHGVNQTQRRIALDMQAQLLDMLERDEQAQTVREQLLAEKSQATSRMLDLLMDHSCNDPQAAALLEDYRTHLNQDGEIQALNWLEQASAPYLEKHPELRDYLQQLQQAQQQLTQCLAQNRQTASR